MEEKFCKFCGEKIPMDAVVCTHCGRQVEELKSNKPDGIVINNVANASAAASANVISERGRKAKNKWVALLLCIFTICGHKFYEGKTGTGILYLFTLGLFGIGVLIDWFGYFGKIGKKYYV